MKKCSVCGEVKDLTNYYKYMRHGKLYTKATCSRCTNRRKYEARDRLAAMGLRRCIKCKTNVDIKYFKLRGSTLSRTCDICKGEIELKTCTKCKKEKPVTEFRPQRRQCIACINEWKNENRQQTTAPPRKNFSDIGDRG